MDQVVGILTAVVAVGIIGVSLGALVLVITGANLPQMPRPKPREKSQPAALVATLTPEPSSDATSHGATEIADDADQKADTSEVAADRDETNDAGTTPITLAPPSKDEDLDARRSVTDSGEPIPLAAPEETDDLPSRSAATSDDARSDAKRADVTESKKVQPQTNGRSTQRQPTEDDL